MSKEVINVIWYGNPEGTEYRVWWDMALLGDIFSKMTDNGYDLKHYEGIDSFDEDQGGAVVVIPSRLWVDKEEQISESIQKLRYALMVFCGNEDGTFDSNKIRHPRLRVWMQLPRMNIHNDVSYRLPNGYRPKTPQILKDIGYQERTLDFFFAGQVNHARREQCVEALKEVEKTNPNGKYFTTSSFTEEAVDQKTYLDYLAHTKVALCPSGIESPDSFRLYEALEAGCLPVVDAFSTRHQAPGFWNYLLGDDVPFPIIDYWDKFPALLPQLLKEWPANVNRVSAWYMLKKREIYWKLLDDLKELKA